jgi:nitrogen-specific signal transduction histidine kinase
MYADRLARKLVIRDTGTGIDPDVAEQLFSPFFSTKRNGQGIGLTLIREVLIGHGFLFSLRTAGGYTEFEIRV